MMLVFKDASNGSRDRRLNQDSLEQFSKIAYECLTQTQVKCPTIEVAFKELEKALFLKSDSTYTLRICEPIGGTHVKTRR
nr:serine/threonine-protein kinase, active site protein [Tanacetum cinerariifolium]